MCNIRELNSALAKKAAEELNENPNDREYYIKALRDWLLEQKHFRARTTDQFLIVFLRASKFSLERAKQKIENFYIYRSMMPEIFANRNVSDSKIDDIIKSGCLLYLPTPIAIDGPRVVILRPKYFDLNKHTIPDVFKVGSMATDVLLCEDDNAIIAGYIFIMDLSNVPKNIVRSFDPIFVRKMTIVANKISPTRMKGFHILNVPPIFEKLFNLVKGAVNVKLRNRFHLHSSDMETLYKYVPKQILPKEYGGECDIESLKIEWLKNKENNKMLIAEEDTYGVIADYKKANNSSKQQLHVRADADVFGIDGSFRKLSID